MDLLIGLKAAENTQLREEFGVKSLEEEERCKAESATTGEILEGEAKCEKRRWKSKVGMSRSYRGLEPNYNIMKAPLSTWAT